MPDTSTCSAVKACIFALNPAKRADGLKLWQATMLGQVYEGRQNGLVYRSARFSHSQALTSSATHRTMTVCPHRAGLNRVACAGV